MTQTDSNIRKRLQAGIGMLTVTIVVVGLAIATSSSKNASAINNKTNSKVKSVNSSSGSNVSYKNGSYSAYGVYDSPGGQESIRISLTLNNDVVTASSAQSGANDSTATSYQDLFIGGYKSQVIGKKINTINLSNISGSSLTAQGFNDALEQIENQAQT